ncbi:Phosphoribosylformylglycinamidine synthase, synthetase subunit [Labilithrix luteola]|uniref:Phosphoribosylformylglycinamidine synthase subunit PurL n=1 Tax=Labilithrix luteola TaxID=1391654 RepID=A0A0K1PYE6_9BACT|nr:phosphoribosylformylglycinamidine synthase subunit PurL [Labilithrix luteola]AKU98550.1 Phosphoribosylformylglycinamidine synthase, synthetase subunit [Labilithrix luteola]
MTAAPHAFPGDLPIEDSLIKQHKLTPDEYARVEKALGRKPSYTELGVFSVMWSEHCSYKSSRVHLRRLPTKGPRVIQGPGENAGVVDIGDGFAAVFKMESHNHPSFIEPYQGAATGVGGILRDVFTMGARPIASLNSLRFGSPDHPRTPELLRGVVAGIGGYGNSIGVPTVGGEVQFDPSYDGNILVNAFTCGVARTDRIFYGRAAGIGNPILYIGAKTGRDGIHGATMASDEFGSAKEGTGELATASSIKKGVRSTMQVGDPFMEKLLLEACLELFAADVLEGIQDMGAAGLTSSSVEMAGRAGNGIEIDLDLIPRRARKMTPYELLLSESQERMLLVAKRGCEDAVIAICKKWDLDAAIVGRVTDSKRWVVKATPGFDPLDGGSPSGEKQIAADIPVDVLTDDAPLYDRPRQSAPVSANVDVPESTDPSADLLALLGSPNVGSRAWIWRQYDHIVRGGTVVRPGSDAAVVRVPCSRDGKVIDKHLAFAVDCNGRFVELSPEEGAKMAIAEVCRNLVCSGAEPIGITDCLNFASPEVPTTMDQIARAIDGLAEACRALEVPIVSGNVSLYNETNEGEGASRVRRPILPTPSVAAVGLLQKETDVVTQWFAGEGDVVFLLGTDAGEAGLGGSEYQSLKSGKLGGPAPRIDLDAEKKLQKLVLDLARGQLLASAHDVADGGLAVAIAECCATAPGSKPAFGAKVTVPAGASVAASLFGEAPLVSSSRFARRTARRSKSRQRRRAFRSSSSAARAATRSPSPSALTPSTSRCPPFAKRASAVSSRSSAPERQREGGARQARQTSPGRSIGPGNGRAFLLVARIRSGLPGSRAIQSAPSHARQALVNDETRVRRALESMGRWVGRWCGSCRLA